jgi:hypothetical protein
LTGAWRTLWRRVSFVVFTSAHVFHSGHKTLTKKPPINCNLP